MIKISHEVPLCLLEESRSFNDYDYALVHLFEKYPEYYNFYKTSLEMDREVILDNSLYELGETFDPKEYCKWIEKLQPTWYIIPDAFSDKNKTIELCEEWFNNYYNKDINSKTIGVVHGKTYDEIVECYNYLNGRVDKIAFNFADEVYNKMRRPKLIGDMIDDNIITKFNYHHLLGCKDDIHELGCYGVMGYDCYFDSLDTSAPIMYSYENKCLYEGDEFYFKKPKIKLEDVFKSSINNNDKHIILENIKYFREVVNEN